MNKLISKAWWLKAAERAIKTFSQSVVALVGTNAVLSFADWKQIVVVSITAAVLSVLTSIASIKDDSAPESAGQAQADEAGVIMSADAEEGEQNA